MLHGFIWEILWGLVHGEEAWADRPQEKFLAHFVAHCESCAQDVENAVLWLGFVIGCFWETDILYYRTCIFSMLIVKSLQLHGHRQIAEPRKYCLVRVIFFFGMCFLYFCFSPIGNFTLIPYRFHYVIAVRKTTRDECGLASGTSKSKFLYCQEGFALGDSYF